MRQTLGLDISCYKNQNIKNELHRITRSVDKWQIPTRTKWLGSERSHGLRDCWMDPKAPKGPEA